MLKRIGLAALAAVVLAVTPVAQFTTANVNDIEMPWLYQVGAREFEFPWLQGATASVTDVEAPWLYQTAENVSDFELPQVHQPIA